MAGAKVGINGKGTLNTVKSVSKLIPESTSLFIWFIDNSFSSLVKLTPKIAVSSSEI